MSSRRPIIPYPTAPPRDQIRRVEQAHIAATGARKGLLLGTHTLEETEAVLERFYEAEAELRGRGNVKPGYVKYRVETEMNVLRKRHARLNTPEAKAKAAAKAKERQAKTQAKTAVREAVNKLKTAEEGALKGTHTLKQVEAAATKALTLEFNSRRLGGSDLKFPGKPMSMSKLLKLKHIIAERQMKDARTGVMNGTHSFEEAEKATMNFHQLLAATRGKTIDNRQLRAIAERELTQLKKAMEAKNKSQESGEQKMRLEVQRMEAAIKALIAKAGDERLSPAERAGAKKRLEEMELHAAQLKHGAAMRKAEVIAMRVLEKREPAAAAEAAFEAESEASHEVEQIWLKRERERAQAQLDSQIKWRVDSIRRRIAENEQKKKDQERLIKERERARQERKIQAEKNREERKLRAKKDREERKLRDERDRQLYLREEAAEERRRKQQKKAADSLVRAEAERAKKSGKGEICEYRLVMSELWGYPEERATLSKVCIDQNGTFSRAAANGLHPLTCSLLATWSLISIPPDEVGQAVLETLRTSLNKCEPGDGYLINVVRDLEQDSRRLPLDEYLEVLERTQVWMMNTSARWHSLHDVKRIKQELVAALKEMPEAFEKPPLPFFLLS